ncbi:MAG: CHAT domain-containing protein [Proteobacteria bacterium]|nr:CHAT domain-containing protein [Pseudomonadota bacterium]
MTQSSLSIEFEFARTDTPDDPYAFRFGPQSYALRTREGGRKQMDLDWTDELLGELEALREPNCDPAVIQRLAHTLQTFVEPAGWSWLARDIADAVQRAQPVRITVRSAAAELYTLPWGLLSLEGSGQCVGELPGVLVRYEWPDTRTAPIKQDTANRPGRVLVAWSDAAGAVPADQHIAAIDEACRRGNIAFESDRDVVPHTSIGKLADALDRAIQEGRPVSMLHILCHGGAVGQTAGLMLDDERSGRGAVAVDAWRLRQLLAPYASTLRLIVIAACESAQASRFDSVAQALHRVGFQAVVGSRFLLSVQGSIHLTETLYQEMLAKRSSLEQAFLHARSRLARNTTRLDWASLQLYARQADGDETNLLSAAPAAHSTRAAPSQSTGSGQSEALSLADIATLGLGDLLELRNHVTGELSSRFAHSLALVCTDIVGSTELFARLGSKAAKKLQERYRELFEEVATIEAGRIFASDGDGLRACFPAVKSAIKASFAFLDSITKHNYEISREDQLIVRVGIHYGPVLTNGDIVAGEEVELAASIVAQAEKGEIQLSQRAFRQTAKGVQALCRPLPSIDVFDDTRTINLYHLPRHSDAN